MADGDPYEESGVFFEAQEKLPGSLEEMSDNTHEEEEEENFFYEKNDDLKQLEVRNKHIKLLNDAESLLAPKPFPNEQVSQVQRKPQQGSVSVPLSLFLGGGDETHHFPRGTNNNHNEREEDEGGNPATVEEHQRTKKPVDLSSPDGPFGAILHPGLHLHRTPNVPDSDNHFDAIAQPKRDLISTNPPPMNTTTDTRSVNTRNDTHSFSDGVKENKVKRSDQSQLSKFEQSHGEEDRLPSVEYQNKHLSAYHLTGNSNKFHDGQKYDHNENDTIDKDNGFEAAKGKKKAPYQAPSTEDYPDDLSEEESNVDLIKDQNDRQEAIAELHDFFLGFLLQGKFKGSKKTSEVGHAYEKKYSSQGNDLLRRLGYHGLVQFVKSFPQQYRLIYHDLKVYFIQISPGQKSKLAAEGFSSDVEPKVELPKPEIIKSMPKKKFVDYAAQDSNTGPKTFEELVHGKKQPGPTRSSSNNINISNPPPSSSSEQTSQNGAPASDQLTCEALYLRLHELVYSNPNHQLLMSKLNVIYKQIYLTQVPVSVLGYAKLTPAFLARPDLFTIDHPYTPITVVHALSPNDAEPGVPEGLPKQKSRVPQHSKEMAEHDRETISKILKMSRTTLPLDRFLMKFAVLTNVNPDTLFPRNGFSDSREWLSSYPSLLCIEETPDGIMLHPVLPTSVENPNSLTTTSSSVKAEKEPQKGLPTNVEEQATIPIKTVSLHRIQSQFKTMSQNILNSQPTAPDRMPPMAPSNDSIPHSTAHQPMPAPTMAHPKGQPGTLAKQPLPAKHSVPAQPIPSSPGRTLRHYETPGAPQQQMTTITKPNQPTITLRPAAPVLANNAQPVPVPSLTSTKFAAEPTLPLGNVNMASNNLKNYNIITPNQTETQVAQPHLGMGWMGPTTVSKEALVVQLKGAEDLIRNCKNEQQKLQHERNAIALNMFYPNRELALRQADTKLAQLQQVEKSAITLGFKLGLQLSSMQPQTPMLSDGLPPVFPSGPLQVSAHPAFSTSLPNNQMMKPQTMASNQGNGGPSLLMASIRAPFPKASSNSFPQATPISTMPLETPAPLLANPVTSTTLASLFPPAKPDPVNNPPPLTAPPSPRKVISLIRTPPPQVERPSSGTGTEPLPDLRGSSSSSSPVLLTAPSPAPLPQPASRNPTPSPSDPSLDRTTPTPTNAQDQNEVDECIICFEPLPTAPSRDLMVNPCGHAFHSKCQEQWFQISRSCPICRTHTILEQDFPSLSASVGSNMSRGLARSWNKAAAPQLKK